MPQITLIQLIVLGGTFIDKEINEIIVPLIWEEKTFVDKVGKENTNMMWRFKDKGGRAVCLIPEVTGIIQEMWRNNWSKSMKKPTKIFYVSRCYRYERPQKGRYREFTQIGVEILDGNTPDDRQECIDLLKGCLNLFDLDYTFNDLVQRGLSYYVEDGFEVEIETLGAQKQIAGGGRYAEGVGWALGLDRLLLCK